MPVLPKIFKALNSVNLDRRRRTTSIAHMLLASVKTFNHGHTTSENRTVKMFQVGLDMSLNEHSILPPLPQGEAEVGLGSIENTPGVSQVQRLIGSHAHSVQYPRQIGHTVWTVYVQILPLRMCVCILCVYIYIARSRLRNLPTLMRSGESPEWHVHGRVGRCHSWVRFCGRSQDNVVITNFPSFIGKWFKS